MPKKLIEVALPLEAINVASAKEKSIRHGHPSTLHLWWARRPLAACRAVLFASLVDDPSAHPEQFPTEADQERERLRLFKIIEELVLWENSTNEKVLNAARQEILKSTGGKPPPVYDPFCGGGSIPLEAQRLGLEAHGSDLNPVAVLITKALIEIPPKFAGQPPVHAGQSKLRRQDWIGASGLAEDVRYYAKWIHDEAEKRIGHLYPKVKLPQEHGGGEATVIAWLWARTVECPNPACRAKMPLVGSFLISRRPGRETWVEPVVKGNTYEFMLRSGEGAPDGVVNRQGARCVCCQSPVPFTHIRAEGKAGRMGRRLLAIVAEAPRGRIYLPPNSNHEDVANQATGGWESDAMISHWPGRTNVVEYGLTTFGSLFTARQLSILTTFSNLVVEARDRVLADARTAGLRDDAERLSNGGRGADAYADAVVTYLGLGVSKATDYNSSLVVWSPSRDQAKSTFARQALPMVWDFAEVNPLVGAAGDPEVSLNGIAKALVGLPSMGIGAASQHDAASAGNSSSPRMFSTDPPYYDNIGYADLSDFFYVWLRRSLQTVLPSLLTTMLVPKEEELVANPYRFGGSKEKAEHFFEAGFGKAFARMRDRQHPDYPLTVFYAFKQAEDDEELADDRETGTVGRASTGWETMLEGLLKAGFSIDGTWPMRTERGARNLSIGMNALASSIVLVCRPRPLNAPKSDRAKFTAELKRDLPTSLKKLQHGNIAPVDLAQASIGPGMAIFSKYEVVREANGQPMTVRTALQLINKALDEVLAEQEGEYDAETRWAVAWFEQFGMDEGPYGDAETLSKAKNCALARLQHSGLLESRGGKAKLIQRQAMPEAIPPNPGEMTVWEVAQRLIRALLGNGGEAEAAQLLTRVGYLGDVARDLAYRLYTTCERRRWAQEALAYNSLVIAWPQITRLAQSAPRASVQPNLPGAE